MNACGKLYVFEGADNVGKSTLSEWLGGHLQKSGIRCKLLSSPGKELGTLGRHIWELHHDPSQFGITHMLPASLQLLHVAAHIEGIEAQIKPLLESGETVVLDRSWWSTFVYGSVAGVPRSLLRQMIALEQAVWDPIKPHRVFLITRDASIGAESVELWSAWRDAYLNLAVEEQRKYPVSIISNELLPEAKKRILENL